MRKVRIKEPFEALDIQRVCDFLRREGLFGMIPFSTRVKMQKVILRMFFNFPALMKVNFQRSVKLKNPPKADFLYLSAGKEGQISNQFKEDLFKIIDFLEINEREIYARLKEK